MEEYACFVGSDSELTGILESFTSFGPSWQTARVFQCLFGTLVPFAIVDHR
jgi:hypothetical protein